MVSRKNIDNIYNIVKEDFTWILEDMEQHKRLLHEEMVESLKQDPQYRIDEYQEKMAFINGLMERLHSIKSEYVSVIKREESSIKKAGGDDYDYLEDWTGTTPEEMELFGIKHSVKFWRDVLLITIDELYKKDKALIDRIVQDNEIRGKKRIYFTYEKGLTEEKFYKKTSFGLYVIVNASANSLYSLALKALESSGYSENDLKIKICKDNDTSVKRENTIIKDPIDNLIKLPREYASISMEKPVFKALIYSILNRENEYGTKYFEPGKLAKKYKGLILADTNYAVPYHPIINIVKYLKDNHFIENYKGTKKGKYLVINDDSLKTWVDNNI